MGEGAPRRGSGGRHPRPRPGARTVRSPRWTLGTNSSSQVGGPLARQYRTAQNIWNTWLRISGTHNRRFGVVAGGVELPFQRTESCLNPSDRLPRIWWVWSPGSVGRLEVCVVNPVKISASHAAPGFLMRRYWPTPTRTSIRSIHVWSLRGSIALYHGPGRA